MSTARTTTVHPPRRLPGWDPIREHVTVAPIEAVGGSDASYSVFVNDVQVGTVSRTDGQSTRKIPGSRLAVRGKAGARKEWRYRLSTGEATPSGLWRDTRAEAIAQMLQHRARRDQA